MPEDRDVRYSDLIVRGRIEVGSALSPKFIRGLKGEDPAMAHKKGQGSSRNGRDSNPKMLGIKLYGGQYARPGAIICRQNGTKWHAGKNVGLGRDWTIFSLVEGTVKFDQNGRRINVVPLQAAAELVASSTS